MAYKNSPAALPMFLIYSVVNGFSLSFIVSLYLPGTVLTAFISSAALFFVMAIVGVVIKKDLSGIGRALIGARARSHFSYDCQCILKQWSLRLHYQYCHGSCFCRFDCLG